MPLPLLRQIRAKGWFLLIGCSQVSGLLVLWYCVNSPLRWRLPTTNHWRLTANRQQFTAKRQRFMAKFI